MGDTSSVQRSWINFGSTVAARYELAFLTFSSSVAISWWIAKGKKKILKKSERILNSIAFRKEKKKNSEGHLWIPSQLELGKNIRVKKYFIMWFRGSHRSRSTFFNSLNFLFCGYLLQTNTGSHIFQIIGYIYKEKYFSYYILNW